MGTAIIYLVCDNLNLSYTYYTAHDSPPATTSKHLRLH